MISKFIELDSKLVNSESCKTNESHFVIKSKKLTQKFSLLLMETCENNTNINVFKVTSATSKEDFKYSTSCYFQVSIVFFNRSQKKILYQLI